ncbi:MAG: ABC transporter permease subunit [Bacilli bacterium]|nr:ABC transporter permease subunit [Bacilli bacterium]MDD4282347.1 ABC transporter permease subunit [Bacilli bacterium]MDD4718462.1 ABC transporter permease subunit [Bacilli bacterium]
MLKRELKINKKSLIIWTSIILVLFFIAYITYSSMMGGETSKALNEMLAIMPEEMLKMFNMDIVDIDTMFGWFKTEGYTFIVIFTCLYSAILGSNILLKEESDKTIDFLHSKPITRNNIVTSKIQCGLINIAIMFTVITVFNIIGMAISNNLQIKLLLMLSVAPIFSAIPFFFIGIFISTFYKKTTKTNGIGIGLVLVSYFIQIISAISSDVEFIKYTSIFTLSDSRDIILNNSLNFVYIIISIVITIITIVGIYKRYNNKELV